MNLTLGIIAATVLISWLARRYPMLSRRLILWPPAVSRGFEYHRLLTCGLIHADGGHLLFNMVTLYFFGQQIERVYVQYVGPFGYLAFYAVAIVVSVLPSYLGNRHNADYRTLGASGAVSAVLFSFILLDPWALLIVFVVPMPAIVFGLAYTGYSLWRDRQGTDRINHSAHLWGAAFGVAVTCWVKPDAPAQFIERLLHPGFSLG